MLGNKFAKATAAAAGLALTAGLVVAPASAATKEIVIWADDTRGKNLTALFAVNKNAAPGYKITVKAYSTFDALKEALDKSTAASGPDIIYGASDWTAANVKNGKFAPVTVTAAFKARYSKTDLDLVSRGGKLYGVPLDINAPALAYNSKLVTSKPQTFGEMVDFYLANKSKYDFGMCITDGGIAWAGHGLFSALGGGAYQFKNGAIDKTAPFDKTALTANIKKYILDSSGKSNGFLKNINGGLCKTQFAAGKVPFAIVGQWEISTYEAAKVRPTLLGVPGPKAGTAGKFLGGVSAAFLTSSAKAHGVEAGAKSLLTNWIGSTQGQLKYQQLEKRASAEKGAAKSQIGSWTKSFAQALSGNTIPEVGSVLGNNAGGSSYWDAAGNFWDAILSGKDVATEVDKFHTLLKKNLDAGAKDL
jgi:maltose/maltodextrin transport system substrate-binding protein